MTFRSRHSKTPVSKVQKPKYITENNGDATPTAGRSGTPSSKSSSRATSPASIAGPTRSSSRKRTPAVSSGRRGTISGSNTPASRASRSSSVASNGPSRSAAVSSSTKQKIKHSGRGYNPSMVNYKESEYHYGSDFEDDEDDIAEDVESVKSDSSSDLEDSRDSDDDLEVESDVDLDNIVMPLPADGDDSRAQTPVPFWLRGEEESIPELKLPPSSEDLLVGPEHVLQVISVYEVLRRFHQILRLTPFRVEDFCAALASEEQSNLLSEIHIALLRTLIRSEEASGATFGPMDQKDSVNAVFFFMDSFTWPECLRSFLQADPTLNAEPLDILTKVAPEYPFAPAEKLVGCRVRVLSFLADQILLAPVVREYIVEDGHQATEEHCRICHRVGEVLVCDTCPGVYHLGCLDPPLQDVPEDEWRCYVCQSNDVDGVTECRPQPIGRKGQSSCRQEALGFDRCGNKYWFLGRRLVVEMQDCSKPAKYYSTVKQLEELSEVLDDEVYERDLWDNMEECRIEMERQMEVTEEITNSKKSASRKSYFDQENGKSSNNLVFFEARFFLLYSSMSSHIMPGNRC